MRLGAADRESILVTLQCIAVSLTVLCAQRQRWTEPTVDLSRRDECQIGASAFVLLPQP